MNQYSKLQKYISANPKVILKEVTSYLECSEQYVRQLIKKAVDNNELRPAGKGSWKAVNSDVATPKFELPVKDRFDYIQDLVHMVAKKVSPSILLTGTSGVGKSHLVQKTLAEAGMEKDKDYYVCKGHSSPLGLYQLLHDHRDDLIVFDDCDSVLRDDLSANLLKAALDSYDTRVIHWHSNKAEQMELESCFEFTGQVIFISNLSANKIDDAIRTRAFCYNLHLSPDEVHGYMKHIIADICPNVGLDMKKEVLDYLYQFRNVWNNYNLRTLIQAIRIRTGVREGRDWKTMIQVLAGGEA